jgi:hypothetical protein
VGLGGCRAVARLWRSGKTGLYGEGTQCLRTGLFSVARLQRSGKAFKLMRRHGMTEVVRRHVPDRMAKVIPGHEFESAGSLPGVTKNGSVGMVESAILVTYFGAMEQVWPGMTDARLV